MKLMSSNNSKPRASYLPQQANMHEVDKFDVDDIIDCTSLNHDSMVDDDDNND
jgi:hypothetical protein